MVAIKTLASTGFHSIAEVEQVQEEMHVLAQLKHPAIIHLYDSMQTPDHSWLLVMEYASGGTLTNYLAKQVWMCTLQYHAKGLNEQYSGPSLSRQSQSLSNIAY